MNTECTGHMRLWGGASKTYFPLSRKQASKKYSPFRVILHSR